jgi:hypothetical protein
MRSLLAVLFATILSTDGSSWLIGYESRTLSCQLRSPCADFVAGELLLPSMGFIRSRELVDYLGAGVLQSCMLHSCVDVGGA